MPVNGEKAVAHIGYGIKIGAGAKVGANATVREDVKEGEEQC
jgi:acetyltransferase-like isoleucine patch superfamily enzyme